MMIASMGMTNLLLPCIQTPDSLEGISALTNAALCQMNNPTKTSHWLIEVFIGVWFCRQPIILFNCVGPRSSACQ
jgi:hypothetical protein